MRAVRSMLTILTLCANMVVVAVLVIVFGWFGHCPCVQVVGCSHHRCVEQSM